MKDTLLFIDPCCPRPYDPSNIDLPGCGGTEQTMVCIAEALSDHYNVIVEQHNRSEDYVSRATYSSYGKTVSSRTVVALRDPGVLCGLRSRFPSARLFLYSHDLAGRDLGLRFREGVFERGKCSTNVCVSEWHRCQSIQTLKAVGFNGEFKHRVVYNPIAAQAPELGAYDPKKLLWLASPHKGLNRAYELFERLLNFDPEFRLYVTNPGYLPDQQPNEKIKDKVVVLGTLPHSDIISHLRTSLCLFYPNTVFPETFGKIMAEANAVGTPVLTHRLGASREVLDSHPAQFVDCTDNKAVIDRLLAWSKGERPIVRGNPKFKIEAVVKKWIEVLNDR